MISRLLYLMIIGVLLFTVDGLGQNTWVRAFGGTGNEIGNSITTTSDGGYVLTGETNSNNYDFTGMNKGGKDIFVLKLNTKGDTVWKKVFGGSSDDYGNSITTTSDGGYVLTGGTISNDGDFSGREWKGHDIFVFKLNTNGDIVWKKTFGGGRNDKGNSITTSSDGGYVLTGESNSDDGYFIGVNKENGYDYIYDIFVMKLNSNGDIVWKKGFGGSGGNDVGMSITTTSDGGYVLTGYTGTNNGDFSGMNKGGYHDIFVIKLNSSGDIVWKKTFGGRYDEIGLSISTTTDSGYVLTGRTNSNDGDFNGMYTRGHVIFVMKLNSSGDILWKKTFGEKIFGWDSFEEKVVGNSITTTSDGGYVLTGKITLSYDKENIFVIKLDKNGDIVWKKMFGGGGDEYGNTITTTSDGGFVLTGVTTSNGGDFIEKKGNNFIFVMKLDKNGNLNKK